MKYTFAIFFLFINFCSFSQVQTERWNSYEKRYEYFDTNGNMTAYKSYNSYLQQWETYKVNNSNNGYSPVKSSINTELLQRTMQARQDKYDNNLAIVKEEISRWNKFIYVVYRDKGYSDEVATSAYSVLFYNDYVSKVINWDFSIKENAVNAIAYLRKSAGYLLCTEIKYCELK